jgi:hypothetical protein
MEQKPAGGVAPPTSTGDLTIPVQESQGAVQQDMSPSSLPAIILPPEDPPPSTAQISDDPLLCNSDFMALKQFVDEQKSSGGQDKELSSEEIVK